MGNGCHKFYKSKAWRDTRTNIWIKQACLCGICGRPVYVDGLSQYIPKEKRLVGIVHHKEHLNLENVYDDSIALDEENLIGLCIDCHNQIHTTENKSVKKGLMFDEYGNIVQTNPPHSNL